MGQECSNCCHHDDREIHATVSRAPDDDDVDFKLPAVAADDPKAKERKQAGLTIDDESPCTFQLQLHSAHITHSVAKLGWMDPYAVISVNTQEVGRTAPDKWAHMEPKWESSFAWSSCGIPSVIKVSVWDKNRFHEDKLCGSVTIPCSIDMGHLERKEFAITKKHTPRGFVVLTMSVDVHDCGDAVQPSCSPLSANSLGGEIDHVVRWSRSRENLGDGPVQLRLAEEASGNELADRRQEPGPATPKAFVPADGELAPALLGSWKCIATQGLDEFLKATGVGVFQRKIAKAAKWPNWEFIAKDGAVLFVNHSAIGDLKEEFSLGKEYSWKDGHGNPMTCLAEYTATEDGGVLLTSRTGAIGSYKEERRVSGNLLEFTLTHGTGVSWGRTFERQN